MFRGTHGFVISLTLFGAACGGELSPQSDATQDGGLDGGSIDASPDAGELDAGELDAGEVDAGELDAGPPPFAPAWEAYADVPPAATPGRWGALMAVVPEDHHLILYAGSHYPNPTGADVWSFDLETKSWSELPTQDAPAPRYCHCGAYIPSTRELLIINGRDENGPVAAGAFTLDLDTSMWTRVEGVVPEGLIGCNAALDPVRDRVIIFGGATRTGLSRNTWVYDPEARSFTQLSPEQSPPARRDGNLVFDPMTDRMLLFGGQVGRTSHLNDVWAFDGSSWSEIVTAHAPPPRRWGSSGIDESGDWLMFGGTNEIDSLADLWRFDVVEGDWVELELDGTPTPRAGAAHAFVPDLDALVVMGGFDAATLHALEDGFSLRYHAD